MNWTVLGLELKDRLDVYQAILPVDYAYTLSVHAKGIPLCDIYSSLSKNL